MEYSYPTNYSFANYQSSVGGFRAPHLTGDLALTHAILGLAGEAGELAEKIKKYFRDGKVLDREDIKKELGDVLWYVQDLGDLFGIPLAETAFTNFTKLDDRNKRGVLSGSGDNR